MTCPDCNAAPGRLCAFHAATDNLTDDIDYELELTKSALFHAHFRNHAFAPASCGGCEQIEMVLRLREVVL